MDKPTQTAGPLARSNLLAYIRDFVDSLTTKTQTRSTYERALREFVRWFDLDGRFLFAVDDVYRYRHYLMDAKKLAPASVSTYLASLRLLLNYLSRQGIISFNPARHIRGSARKRTDDLTYLRHDDVIRLLGSVAERDRRGLRDRAILALMVRHGMTEVELTGANVGDFVFIDGMGALKVAGKYDAAHVLLDRMTAVLIHDYLASRVNVERQQPLFLSDGNRTRGMRMTTRGIRERINRYLRLAGVKSLDSGITPRSLRHTAAMLMADEGSSADEIKYRMRFGSLARAMKYTIRANPPAQS